MDGDGRITTPFHASKLEVKEGSLSNVLGRPFHIFTKYVKVFDLYFVATATCPDHRVLHGASVLYQYIDNDDDGIPDNDKIYAALVSEKATMIMFCDEKEHRKNRKFYRENERCKDVMVQDLQAAETRPGSRIPHKFDASLEECFHLVTEGYKIAYPEVFGFKPGSHVANALDFARGGHFKKVPKQYPSHAWFTYYDHTCDYESMVCEYIYWAMTSILGGQEHRRHEIADEWRHCSCAEVEQHDKLIYKLLTDPKYKFPTKLPVPIDNVSVYDQASPRSSDDSGSENSDNEHDHKPKIRDLVKNFFSHYKH